MRTDRFFMTVCGNRVCGALTGMTCMCGSMSACMCRENKKRLRDASV